MQSGTAIEYHLGELRIALDPTAKGHNLPSFTDDETAILDLGCGIGQSLVAAGGTRGRLLVGVDVDQDCLAYGQARFSHVALVRSWGETLPFRDASFDVVISRVALPYTVLAQSLPETFRVLREGGRAWFSLHPFAKVRHHLAQALRALAWRDILFQCYVMANGVVLHAFGKQFRFPVNGRCEAFQTTRSMLRLLGRSGFADVQFPPGEHFVCTARKPSGGHDQTRFTH